MLYREYPFYPWHDGFNKPISYDSKIYDEDNHVATLLYDNWNNRPFGAVQALLITIYSIAILSNIVLLTFFVGFESIRSVRSNKLIGSLSVFNAISCCHLLLSNIVFEPTPGPGALCDFIVYAGVVFCASSNVSRCAIAVDRYIFISDPLRYYQRLQGTMVTIAVISIYAIVTVLVILPYVVTTRDDHVSERCLPAYPTHYKIFVIVLLVILPCIILSVIYTRIFFWAFLQMQILRQRTKQFSRKVSTKPAEQIRPNPLDSVSSDQLRLYTSAAMLLTPTSPFSNKIETLETQDGGELRIGFDTAVHGIIHTLAGLKDTGNTLRVSTSVDNISHQKIQKGLDNNNHNVNNKDENNQDTTASSVFGKIESWFLLKKEKANTLFKYNTKSQGSSSSVPSIPNTNENAKVSHESKHGSRADPKNSKYPDDSTTFRDSTTFEQSLTPDFDLGIKIPQSTGPRKSRSYVPVTAEGKWIEAQMANFDLFVEMGAASDISSDSPNLSHRLFCAELKAAGMTMGLMGVFFVCWMPFLIIQILEVVGERVITSHERVVSISLIGIMCALDPITYAVMNPPLRKAVSKAVDLLLRKYCPGCHKYVSRKSTQKSRKLTFKYSIKKKESLLREHFDSTSII